MIVILIRCYLIAGCESLLYKARGTSSAGYIKAPIIFYCWQSYCSIVTMVIWLCDTFYEWGNVRQWWKEKLTDQWVTMAWEHENWWPGTWPETPEWEHVTMESWPVSGGCDHDQWPGHGGSEITLCDNQWHFHPRQDTCLQTSSNIWQYLQHLPLSLCLLLRCCVQRAGCCYQPAVGSSRPGAV